MYIENINSPADIKQLNTQQLNVLADEMRHALLKRASIHGGHFGPNFGMVEATIALHYVFDSPIDKIVFDVSHQCYPHKMLTGRKDAYLYEEHYDDVSGYTNPHESEHDFFHCRTHFNFHKPCMRSCQGKRFEGRNRKCYCCYRRWLSKWR